MNTFTSTNALHSREVAKPGIRLPTIPRTPTRKGAMARIEELADRIERLLLRHEELQRTSALLHEQLAAVSSERDNLRSRLSAARSRIDVLLDRLPRDNKGASPADGAARPPEGDGAWGQTA